VEKSFFVGVEIGGTKVAAGLVNADGEIPCHLRVPIVSNSAQFSNKLEDDGCA
jgi:predicted NBD/HSP70 family sugar kinase